MTTYRVRARPLDDIVEESGVARVDAIRIDVEGAEYLVLKGAHETLERYHPEIIVELVERQLQAMGTSTAQVVALSVPTVTRGAIRTSSTPIAVTEPPPVK